jgi:hypothetical protein
MVGEPDETMTLPGRQRIPQKSVGSVLLAVRSGELPELPSNDIGDHKLSSCSFCPNCLSATGEDLRFC